MIRRMLAALLIVWLLGFAWFAAALPQPEPPSAKTDVIVVPTGGSGRIERGLAMLRARAAGKLFVSGVDRQVRPQEFAAEYKVTPAEMACCVVLGFADKSGDEKANLQTSQDRAAFVADLLHKRCGVANVVQTIPMGASEFFHPQASTENRVAEVWAVLP